MEVKIIKDSTRKEYFKARREKQKVFSCYLDKDYLEPFEEKLKEKRISKVQWLKEKIDEEMAKKD